MVEQTNTAQPFHWPPLEGNAEIFTEYMVKGGLDGSKFAFNEIFGFEEDLLAFIPTPRYGVIICAERLKKAEDKEEETLPSRMNSTWTRAARWTTLVESLPACI